MKNALVWLLFTIGCFIASFLLLAIFDLLGIPQDASVSVASVILFFGGLYVGLRFLGPYA